jgi:hypothetical protein
MDWSRSISETQLAASKPRSCVSIHGILSRPRTPESDDNSKNNRDTKHNRYNKYIYPVKTLCLLALSVIVTAPASAETVGGVSATAAPVANSSGSVTNQAIQVLQGPYITNTYGGGVQCQGPTMNFTPYVTGAVAAQKPFQDHYNDPVYDITDNFGAFDDSGQPLGDGVLDNPGSVLFTKKTRTAQKDNYNLGVGFSMTWSRPMDKNLQRLCKDAAQTQIELQQQIISSKRLEFEIARLKNCGNLAKEGIQFHPRSPYHKICADVLINNPPGHKHPHLHAISSEPSAEPESHSPGRAEHLGDPLQTQPSQPSP